jgi:hypothetical protein
MATRLELSEGKLIRLVKERDELTKKAMDQVRKANGQPMNDKRGGVLGSKSAIAMIKEYSINLMR